MKTNQQLLKTLEPALRKRIDLWFAEQHDKSFTTILEAVGKWGNDVMFAYYTDPKALYWW